jgi:hypothetical protein
VSEQELIQLQANLVAEEKLKQAKMMTPAEKIFGGIELFEESYRISLAGLRFRSPELSEEEARAKLDDAIAWRATTG